MAVRKRDIFKAQQGHGERIVNLNTASTAIPIILYGVRISSAVPEVRRIIATSFPRRNLSLPSFVKRDENRMATIPL